MKATGIGVKNGFLGGFRKEQNNILNMRQKSIDLSSKNEIFKLSQKKPNERSNSFGFCHTYLSPCRIHSAS